MRILNERLYAASVIKRAIVALAMHRLIPIRAADWLVANLGLAHV